MLDFKAISEEHQLVNDNQQWRYASLDELAEEYGKGIIDICVKALRSANLTRFTKTTYDHDMAEGVREELINSLEKLKS